jgi:hypothetical protein
MSEKTTATGGAIVCAFSAFTMPETAIVMAPLAIILGVIAATQEDQK